MYRKDTLMPVPGPLNLLRSTGITSSSTIEAVFLAGRDKGIQWEIPYGIIQVIILVEGKGNLSLTSHFEGKESFSLESDSVVEVQGGTTCVFEPLKETELIRVSFRSAGQEQRTEELNAVI